jgi:hypothetical protein
MPIHSCSYACIRHQHSLIENLEAVIANVPKSLYCVCFLNLLNIWKVVFFSFQPFSVYITRKRQTYVTWFCLGIHIREGFIMVLIYCLIGERLFILQSVMGSFCQFFRIIFLRSFAVRNIIKKWVLLSMVTVL